MSLGGGVIVLLSVYSCTEFREQWVHCNNTKISVWECHWYHWILTLVCCVVSVAVWIWILIQCGVLDQWGLSTSSHWDWGL